MREIVLDTETTGLDPKSGHRIVEIGCVELMNLLPTGRTYQVYINPERDVPAEASAISGIQTEFLRDKPLFKEIVQGFLDFIQASPLVIHNANFDIGFLNAEFSRLDIPAIPMTRAIDTVRLAKAKFQGAPASLDALCKRFGLDLSVRVKHGALLDAQLLAQVYLELKGGRQTALSFVDKKVSPSLAALKTERIPRVIRPHTLQEREKMAHQALLSKIKNPLWENL